MAITIAALLWIVFVLLPWLAETTAAPALRAPITATERVERLRRATQLAPWDARYASELGRSLLARAFAETDAARRDRLTQARAALQYAVWLAPFDGELHALLGRSIAAQVAQSAVGPGGGPAAPARAQFDRAIALEPENANVLELMTQGYLEMGLTRDARAAALQCVRLFPDFALPMADLGVAALIEGRPQAAADTLTLAMARNWHGEEGAAMAAKSNYVAALREMRLGDVLKRK